MFPGWAELVQTTKDDLHRGRLDRATVWRSFEELAASSEHASALELLVTLGRRLPEVDQVRIVVAATQLLAATEWPASLRGPRQDLVRALAQVLQALGPVEELTDDLRSSGLMAGYAMLATARSLLSRPCARADIPSVARLCNAALLFLVKGLREEAGAGGSRVAARGDLHPTVMVALGGYWLAAAAFNKACGTAFFDTAEDAGEDRAVESR